VALVALGALRPILAISTSGATRPIRARVTLVALGSLRALRTLLAPRRLSSASLLNTVKLSRSNRGAARRAVSPLIRRKSHQTSLPGKLDAPGVSLPPQRPRRRP